MALDRVQLGGVTKRFGYQRALAAVSLELEAGSLTAVLGPNGAGKTTMLGILSTLVRPTVGDVEYHEAGRPRAVDDELRREIGVLAHASLCYNELSAVENLEFFAQLYRVGSARVAELLDQVGLDRKARQRPARTYSRGMLQRLALARSLLAEPSLLLLDEPFTGLDRTGAASLAVSLARAKQAGTIVLVVTHDLDAIDGLADHLVVLKRGQIAHREHRREAQGQGRGGYSAAELRDAYDRFAGEEMPRGDS